MKILPVPSLIQWNFPCNISLNGVAGLSYLSICVSPYTQIQMRFHWSHTHLSFGRLRWTLSEGFKGIYVGNALWRLLTHRSSHLFSSTAPSYWLEALWEWGWVLKHNVYDYVFLFSSVKYQNRAFSQLPQLRAYCFQSEHPEHSF